MSLLKFNVRDQGMPRQAAQGDLLGAAETITALATAGAGTLTGAILASNIINRTGPVGDVADTTDTASLIIAAVPNANSGDSWRVRFINTVAHVITWTAGTGVTVTNGVVNSSSVKEFLIQLTNATPQVVVPNCQTTNGNKIITGMRQSQTDQITVGMLVTGTGAGASAKVVGVQPGIGVTVDVNSSATTTASTPTTLTFSPAVLITGLGQGLL